MTVLDDKLVPKTLSLIAKFGKIVTFVREGLEIYAPATGHTTQAGPTTFDRAVTPPSPYKTQFIDGDTIQVGDVKVLVAASGLPFTIVKGMKVKIDGVIWLVVQCIRIYSGTSIAAYEVQLRM